MIASANMVLPSYRADGDSRWRQSALYFNVETARSLTLEQSSLYVRTVFALRENSRRFNVRTVVALTSFYKSIRGNQRGNFYNMPIFAVSLMLGQQHPLCRRIRIIAIVFPYPWKTSLPYPRPLGERLAASPA